MKIDRRTLLGSSVAALATPAILTTAARPLRADDAPVAAANPRFLRRKVGAFEVTTLLDGFLPVAPDLITGFDEAAARAALSRQHISGPALPMAIPAQGYVVNTGDKLIAIDAGTVNGFVPSLGNYHAALKQAGFEPADIDVMLITHMHVDHVGQLSDGAKALFPNAELWVSEDEWNFWWNTELMASMPEGMQPFIQIAQSTTAPYKEQVKTFKGDQEIVPGFRALALPGHTPGHSGFEISSEGQSLVMWGDVIHLTKLQFDNPGWTLAFDMDPETTLKTRARMLDMVATDGLMVAGSHLDFPGVGFVEKNGAAYRFVQAPFDYSL